jgi:hypothetical protein
MISFIEARIFLHGISSYGHVIISLFMSRHWGYFYFGVIISEVNMHIHLQIFIQTYAFIYNEKIYIYILKWDIAFYRGTNPIQRAHPHNTIISKRSYFANLINLRVSISFYKSVGDITI